MSRRHDTGVRIGFTLQREGEKSVDPAPETNSKKLGGEKNRCRKKALLSLATRKGDWKRPRRTQERRYLDGKGNWNSGRGKKKTSVVGDGKRRPSKTTSNKTVMDAALWGKSRGTISKKPSVRLGGVSAPRKLRVKGEQDALLVGQT